MRQGPERSLPADTVAEGVQRLGWLALAYVIASITGPSARLALAASEGAVDRSDFGIPDVFGLGAVITAIAVFVAVRQGDVASKRLLDVGLGFHVVGALGITVREFWRGLPIVATSSFFVPAECVWLVVYPLLVPNTPRKILVTSLVSASMGPLGLAISAAAHGTHVDRPFEAAAYFLTSSYPCAIMAYVISRGVHRFNMRLKDAIEIGSYQLTECIGAGGMGEVWRAEHRLLARPAAIKLIRSAMLGDTEQTRATLVRRFEREARQTATLDSVHTIDVYDFGVTEKGDFYYVMQLLDGLSVQRLVEEFGPVNPARTISLLRQVCHSLGEAHARGLVHRDVKPANILLCRLGPDHDFVKVLDFGLVKDTAAEQTMTVVSMEGIIVGTPSYMAPESTLGHREVDGRTDIYSLGCVAYYMLTGQPVFSEAMPIATAVAHVSIAPVPLRLRSSVTIPLALDALIMECLAKDPDDRPASAAVVSERLAAAIPADAWTVDAARSWWERHQPLTPARATESSVEEPTSANVVRLRPRPV